MAKILIVDDQRANRQFLTKLLDPRVVEAFLKLDMSTRQGPET
jgi:CheY-like chemotaxis protein